MIYHKVYSEILENATQQEAIEYARGVVWCELDTSSQSIAHGEYIATSNGIDIYYDYGADYFFFADAVVS